jgi:iron complex outermembrane receptor protein
VRLFPRARFQLKRQRRYADIQTVEAIARSGGRRRDFFRRGRVLLVAASLAGARAFAMAGDDTTPAAPTTDALKGLSLEDLSTIKVETVVAASKHRQEVGEAPSSVTIVTADQIKKSGYNTLADALNSVPGLYTRYDRNYTLLGIGGFSRPGDYNSSFLLMVDGHRVNDALTGNAPIDRCFGVDVDMIERIEVIRGPGASLYGDNAIFGVINVVTRRGGGLNGAEVSASAASFAGYDGRFSYGNKLTNGVEMAFSGSYFHSDGNPGLFYPEFDTRADNYGVASRVDGETAGNLFGSASWRDFALEGSFSDRIKQIPTASYGTVFDDPRNKTKDDNAFADLKWEHQFEDGWRFQARLGYDRDNLIGTYIYNEGPPNFVANLDDFLSQRLTGDLEASRIFFENHTVTAGAQLASNFDEHQQNYDVYPSKVYLDDNHPGQNYGLYLQDEYRIVGNLILNAGARYDNFYSFGSTANPRVALIYRPAETTSLKLLYGTAFRAPTPYERYYNDGGISQVASPNLKPETIASYELVAEQQIGKHLSASASGFYYEMENLIETATVPAGEPYAGAIQLQNLGGANAKGAELASRGAWAGGFAARASYSFTDARDTLTGARLVNSPENLLKFGVTAPLYKAKIFATLEWDYMSDRITLGGQETKGFGTANFTLFTRELLKGVELSASVYNLFDVKYSDPGGPEHAQDTILQNGRTGRVKLTWHF